MTTFNFPLPISIPMPEPIPDEALYGRKRKQNELVDLQLEKVRLEMAALTDIKPEPPATQSSELKPLDDNPLNHKERRSYLRVIASLMATIRSKPFDIHNTSAVALLEEITKQNNYSISNDTARKIVNLLKNLESDN